MRRLIVIGFAVCGLLAGAGTVSASSHRARAASTVPLVVVRAKDGETVALARVTIHGRAFTFLIDTGATRSVVDVALARQLHLRTVGRPITVSGVGCTSSSRNVRLTNWRIAGQPLPSITAVSTKISFGRGRAIGLLGSDVLAHFGAATIDYQHAELTLG
jgi:predicted aspartyl protease